MDVLRSSLTSIAFSCLSNVYVSLEESPIETRFNSWMQIGLIHLVSLMFVICLAKPIRSPVWLVANIVH